MYQDEHNRVNEAAINQAFLRCAQDYIEDTLDCLDNDEISTKLPDLLKRKANPSIYLTVPSISEQPISLFAAAIHIGVEDNFEFAHLLLKHGVDVVMPVTPSAPPLTTKALATDNLLPLQVVCEKIKKEFYGEYRKNSLLRTLFHRVSAQTNLSNPWIYDEIQKSIAAAYDILWGILNEQSILAKQNNKQLLVLVGETHEHVIETIINTLLLKLTCQFDIPNIMIEHTQRYSQDLQKTLSKKEPIEDPYLLELWSPGIAVHVLAHEIGKNIIAIDINKARDNTWNSSEQGLNSRNQGMASEASKYRFASALGIVGCAHLSGLLQHTDLGENYHVFALDISSEKELHKLFEPDFIALASSFLTPVDASKLARKVCLPKQDLMESQQVTYTPLQDIQDSDPTEIKITPKKNSFKPS